MVSEIEFRFVCNILRMKGPEKSGSEEQTVKVKKKMKTELKKIC